MTNLPGDTAAPRDLQRKAAAKCEEAMRLLSACKPFLTKLKAAALSEGEESAFSQCLYEAYAAAGQGWQILCDYRVKSRERRAELKMAVSAHPPKNGEGR